MKKLIALLLFIPLFSRAQDVIPTEDGPLTITPILHGTLVLAFQNKTIYIDPYGGAEMFKGQSSPDIILITDIHGDHHNQNTLDALDLSNAIIVAPQAVADKLPEAWAFQTVIMANGDSKNVKGISLDALPMYNLPETEDSRHPKGRGNGYVLTISDKRIYISGDTEDIPEMRGLKNIDIAFVCMNLPFTMDVAQAADAIIEFKPKIVYPYHYRGSEGLSDTEKFKSLVNKSAPSTEVRLKNWYPEK